MNEEQEKQLDLIITRALDNMLANGKNGTSYNDWRHNPGLKDKYDENGMPKQSGTVAPLETNGKVFLNDHSRKENTLLNKALCNKDSESNNEIAGRISAENEAMPVKKGKYYNPEMDVTELAASFTYGEEAQYDKKSKNLKVYNPPKNDGGGRYEVAGINVRYHPQKAEELKNLIDQGKYKEAETEVKCYYINYSNSAVKWIPDMLTEFQRDNGYPMGEGVIHQLEAIEGLLRDTAFNRGPGGSLKRFQKALNETLETNLSIDGGMGPKSRKAVADLLCKLPPQGKELNNDYWVNKLLLNYKKISQSMEEATGRDNLIKGMTKRVNNRDSFAREILQYRNPVNE